MHSRSDGSFMVECLRLAERGRGWVNPNPMVGAVLVKNGRIIARGYHKQVGLPHAEIEALKRAGTKARGATLYVNLEPCNHFGRTPPCTDAVIAAGIRRVVCAAQDPHAIARGGIEKLRKAGIQVSLGVCEKEARELNEAFFTFHEKGRPLVAIKFAVSLDGKLATRTGDSKWITNEKARSFARALRGEHQSVLVGINTVLKDDPHLGVRQRGRRDPLRIIIDSTLRIPFRAKVLRDSNVLVITTTRGSAAKKKHLEARGVHVRVIQGSRISVKKLLTVLREKEIVSVFVEGGGEVLGSFIDAKIADKVYAFYAPLIIGGAGSSTIGGRGARTLGEALRLKHVTIRPFKNDVLVEGYRY